MGTSPVLENRSILFFDDYCIVCNRLVNWLIKRDKTHLLRFAGLSGSAAAGLGFVESSLEPDTIILLHGGKTYYRSDALLLVASMLGFPLRGLAIFGLLPRRFRDGIYDFLAAHRTRWFGRSDTCLLPSGIDKGIILD